MKRILFVGMANSVHTARWISQVVDGDWEILLFPVEQSMFHPAIPRVKVFNPNLFRPNPPKNRFFPSLWVSPYFYLESKLSRVLGHPVSGFREHILSKVIQFYKPDIVHSLELQHAGYLTLAVKDRLKDDFPVWIATNWGSDIFLFGRFMEHREKIQSILTKCDYYSAECQRDVKLARELGYRNKVLPVLPNGGGFDLEKVSGLWQKGAVSNRKVILLKGYQGWAGRALAGLRALALCADLLKDYQVIIFAASPDVELAARLFSVETKISTQIVPYSDHEDILRLHGQARIYIGLSIADGISTSLLESIVMGALPIQSCTACADEWIVNGQNGFIVPPEDPDIIAQAIRIALTNDALVDKAAEINFKIACERLDQAVITPVVIKMYKDLLMDVC